LKLLAPKGMVNFPAMFLVTKATKAAQRAQRFLGY